MKRWKYAVVAGCFAVMTAACADERTPRADRPADPSAGTPGAAGTSGTAKDHAGPLDRNFVKDMVSDGRAEVELGKLAEDKAANRQVKEFAAMMVREHEKAAEELKTVATRANVDTSDVDVDEHKNVSDRLSKLSGMEFDREYIKQMVDDHEKAVSDVEGKVNSGNIHIKDWATKTLPTLKKHLEQARSIQSTLDRRSGT